MARCDDCMKKPIHPEKKCCFNCARSGTDCDVWHNCGEDCPGWDSKVVTNADKIRAMTVEELAKWMSECNAFGENAEASQWLPWLKKPAEDDC